MSPYQKSLSEVPDKNKQFLSNLNVNGQTLIHEQSPLFKTLCIPFNFFKVQKQKEIFVEKIFKYFDIEGNIRKRCSYYLYSLKNIFHIEKGSVIEGYRTTDLQKKGN